MYKLIYEYLGGMRMLTVYAILTVIGILLMTPFLICAFIIVYGGMLLIPLMLIASVLAVFDIAFKPTFLLFDAVKDALHKISKTIVTFIIGGAVFGIGVVLSNGQVFEVLKKF